MIHQFDVKLEIRPPRVSPQIPLAHLRVERAEIVEPADAEEAKSQQPHDAGADFTEIKPVQAEKSEKSQQDPRDGKIIPARHKAPVGRAIHAGNQEQIDQPADAEKAKRAKPDDAGDRLAVIKPMRAGEAEDPQQITDRLAVRVIDVGWHDGKM